MIDFEKEFNDFIVNNNETNPVTTIYELFPNLTDEQLEIYLKIKYFADKYNNQSIQKFLKTFMEYKSKNKNMNLFNTMSFRKTLESYSLAEQMRGIKIAKSNVKQEQ